MALAEAAPPLLRSRAFALRRAAVNLGMTLGPVAGGFLARVDYAWLFRIDGLTCLAAAILLVRLVPRPAAATNGRRKRRWRRLRAAAFRGRRPAGSPPRRCATGRTSPSCC